MRASERAELRKAIAHLNDETPNADGFELGMRILLKLAQLTSKEREAFEASGVAKIKVGE